MPRDLAMSLPGSSRFDVQFLSKLAVLGGTSAGKTSLNSYKRLVIARGKDIVTLSSENKTCLTLKHEKVHQQW
jgi:hypothetical protein